MLTTSRSHLSTARLRRAVVVVLLLAVAVPVVAVVSGPPASSSPSGLVISEFRVRGPGGANDEFIEIGNTGPAHTVAAASGSGYGVAASDGTVRCTIPNGTIIPENGHYLCVNSVAYSLSGYAAGNGTTATGDATYTADIPDNAGIALFNNNVGGGSFTLANRMDAVGSTDEADTLYKEGTGYPALTPFSIDYSFYRNLSTPSIGAFALDTTTPGEPEDTDNNATDFVFVDTNGTSAGAGQRLGAPGPENLSAPVGAAGIDVSLLDPCVAENNPPNEVRDFTSIPALNSTFGSVSFRRTVTNNTGANVTRLRFRVADQRTFPAPSGTADMRSRTSTLVVVAGIDGADGAPCDGSSEAVNVQGTTLEEPPSSPNGSAFNASMSVDTVTLATPLAPGSSVHVQFLFGLQQTGHSGLRIMAEALPGGTGGAPELFCLSATSTNGDNLCGNTPPTAVNDAYNTPEDTQLDVAAPGVLSNDTDPDTPAGDLDAMLVDDVDNGTLTLNTDGSFAYVPDLDFSGADSFTYNAHDGSNSSATPATVDITVTGVDDAPTATGDEYEAASSTPLEVGAPGVLENDTDPESDPLSAVLDTDVSHGSLDLNADGSFTYTPNPGFDGTDSFTYHATANGLSSSPVTVEIAVTFEVPATPPEGDLDLTLSPSSLEAGDTTTVEGSGFDPGETVHLVLYSDPVVLGSVVVDSDGDIAETVTVPAGTAVGDHDIVAFGADHIGTAQLDVVAAAAALTGQPTTPNAPVATATPASTDALPVTGSELGRLVLIAMALATIGGALVITTQRRRRATPSL